MKYEMCHVRGAIDKETRCEHYQTKNDIIAIKFYCCDAYYSCYLCHEKYGCGNPAVWPKEQFHQKAILCGRCDEELTINEYFDSENSCPFCEAQFNSGCSLHHHLYFDRNV